jgi:ATP-dependent helicase YprA (DUF1998 family)
MRGARSHDRGRRQGHDDRRGRGTSKATHRSRFDRYTGQEDEDERRRIADSPPDILLTNFMMLDLLVHRSDIGIA